MAYLEVPQDVFGSFAVPAEKPWAAGHPDARPAAPQGDVDRAADLLDAGDGQMES